MRLNVIFTVFYKQVKIIKVLYIYKYIIIIYIIDDPQKKLQFLRKHLESESDIREMLKPPKPKTAAELVSK